MGRNYLYEIVIRYDKETIAMSVLINGEPVDGIKKICIEAEDRRPPATYQCEMYMPPDTTMQEMIEKHAWRSHKALEVKLPCTPDKLFPLP